MQYWQSKEFHLCWEYWQYFFNMITQVIDYKWPLGNCLNLSFINMNLKGKIHHMTLFLVYNLWNKPNLGYLTSFSIVGKVPFFQEFEIRYGYILFLKLLNNKTIKNFTMYTVYKAFSNTTAKYIKDEKYISVTKKKTNSEFLF